MDKSRRIETFKEYLSHQVNPVKGVKKYSKSLNETVAVIDCESQEACILYCIDRIKKEVGSLDAKEIVNHAFLAAPVEAQTDIVLGYVKTLVFDYLTNYQKGQVKIVGIGNPNKVKDSVPEEVFKNGLLILCGEIADEILGRVADINGVSDGEAE